MNIQPENQFDFWLGEWDVSWGDNETGVNLIEKILDRKIIRESFAAVNLLGTSLSAYDPERALWCQTWVDNSGSYLDFTGKFENGKMILARNAIINGQNCKQRMVWHDIQENEFTWNWERSDNDGKTWEIKWQILYHRKK